MTMDELKHHLAALTREARATDKTLDDLRVDAEAAKARTLELKQRSVDVQRRLVNGG